MEELTKEKTPEQKEKDRQTALERMIVGIRLHELKKPMTVVKGFANILAEYTQSQFKKGSNPYKMIEEIYTRINDSVCNYLDTFVGEQNEEKTTLRKGYLDKIKGNLLFGERLKLFEDLRGHSKYELKHSLECLMQAHNKTKNALAKIENQEFTYEKAKPLLDNLSQEAYGMILNVNKKINFKSTCSEELNKVELNARDSRDIFMILTTNSEESIEKEGEIEVRSYIEGGEIKIKVKDTGKGIPQDLISKLGTQGMTYGKQNGSGAGLAFVKGIVEGKYDGRLEIYSEGEGKGTEVTVTIPLKDYSKKGELSLN